MMTFDPNKPVQTRDGRKARIICNDRMGYSPLIALVSDKEGEETVQGYRADGTYYYNRGIPNDKRDLVNIPEKRWINLYERGPGDLYHKTKKDAEDTKAGDRGAYVRTIEVELG